MTGDPRVATSAFSRLQAVVAAAGYRGYEFDDFLESPLVRALCCGDLLAQRVAVQAGERSPVNLRRLIGVRKLDSTKARGFFAKCYLWRYEATKDAAWLERATVCLDWLLAHASRDFPGVGWGNAFDFASRGGFFPKGVPTVVWTAHIADAFEHAHEVTGREDDLAALRDSGTFVRLALERHEDADGVCLAYAPGRINLVFNSNLLGAATLLRCWSRFGDEEALDVARAAFAWTLRHQNADGSWYYGVGGQYRWIDNFHTAYVLDCLIAGHELAGEELVPRRAIETTYNYWVQTFFLSDGTPRYYHDRTYPLDIQCAAQAIESLSKWSDRFEGAFELATRVLEWTIRNMQKDNGAFRYQIRRFWKNDLESIHWGQATMLAALGAFLLAAHRRGLDRGVSA